MEKSRFPKFGLSGRHFASRKFTSDGTETIGENSGGLKKFGDGCKPQKILVNSNKTSGTFGFHRGFQEWNVAGSSRKAQRNKEGVGKAPNQFRNVMQKNGCHFGSNQVLFNGHAFSTGFHRSVGAVCKPAGNFGLGLQSSHSTTAKIASPRNAFLNGRMERQKVSRENPSKGAAFGFLPKSMGWSGCHQWFPGPRDLEGKTSIAHKCERTGCSHKYSQIPCKTRETCLPKIG